MFKVNKGGNNRYFFFLGEIKPRSGIIGITDKLVGEKKK